MPIDRTAFNALIDDSGSGTDGSILDKAAIEDVLLTPIDAALAAAAEAAAIDASGDLSFAARSEVTIATGAVVVTLNVHSVDTESNAASDDLDTLTAGTSVRDHHFLILQPENVARVVTVKHNTGNIKLKGGDFAMNDANHRLVLVKDGALWFELARNAGGVSGITNSGTDVTQIKFAATQSASADVNTLDDYEEGTWTPTVRSAGGGTPTYSAQTGVYRKVGSQVWVAAYVVITAKGTLAAGAFTIGGLPFTPGPAILMSGSVGVFVNMTTSIVNLFCYVNGGNTYIEFYHMTGAGTSQTQTAIADIGATLNIACAITYSV